MRTFAQKQENNSANYICQVYENQSVVYWASPRVSSILHLQLTIRNQAVQRLLQSKTKNNKATSKGNISTGLAHDFSRIPVHSSRHSNIQPKLRVGIPGVKYGQRAEPVQRMVEEEPLQGKFTISKAIAQSQ